MVPTAQATRAAIGLATTCAVACLLVCSRLDRDGSMTTRFEHEVTRIVEEMIVRFGVLRCVSELGITLVNLAFTAATSIT